MAERLIDEGLRVEQFPGIIFRSGPAGRRAGIAGGPDVWEVAPDLKNAAHPGDIDEHIRMEEESAERLRRALATDSAA